MTHSSAAVHLPMVECVVPLQRDARYDHAAERTRMAVEVRFRDGRAFRTELVLDPGQMHAAAVQLDRAIAARGRARSAGGQ
ncbi:hypothetical protein [Streptomyces luteireticuli]|uniref:hypothetical protein n=1 Tax=Streptomyces luteireticuli TaxID=173858 RepID=UPI003555FE5E